MVFQINDTQWILKFVKLNSKELRRSDGSYTFGVTDNTEKTIFIASGMTTYMTERVLCHELTHCICFEYGIFLPLEMEEQLCNFMANYGKEIIYLLDDLLGTLQKFA